RAYFLSGETDGACHRRGEPHERTHSRGLAHTVAPHQGDDLAGHDHQRETEQDLAQSITGLDIRDLEECSVSHAGTLPFVGARHSSPALVRVYGGRTTHASPTQGREARQPRRIPTSKPSMPPRANSTTRRNSGPTMICQYPVTRASVSSSTSRARAPSTGPSPVPIPPSTAMTMRS